MQNGNFCCLNLRHSELKTNNVMKEFRPDMSFHTFDVTMVITFLKLDIMNDLYPKFKVLFQR